MSESSAPAAGRLHLATLILVAVLTTLATIALYLPSGVLMPARLVTLLLAALAAIRLWRSRGAMVAPRAVWTVAGVCAVFVVFGIVAMLRFPSQTSVVDAVQFAYIVLTCLAFAILSTSRDVVMAGVWGWLASAVLAAVVGFWEIVTAHHLPGNLPAQQYEGVLPGWNEISSFFDNPNLYAYHLVVTLFLLPVAWSALGHRTRWIVPPAALAFVWLLVRTDGRMAMLTLALGAVLWSLRFRWSRVAAVAAVAITGLTMILSLPPGSQILAFLRLAFDNIQWRGTSVWVRAEMARSGWWMTEQSNFLGVGPGGYARWAFHPDNPYTYEKLNNAHWGMVEILAEYGVVSFVVFLAALIVGVVVALRAASRLRGSGGARLDGTLALAGAIAAATLPILNIANSTWLRQPLTAVHLGLIVSLLTYAAVASRSRPADPTGKTDAG